MAEFTEQVVAGLATGSLFALLALALVLIYQSTEIVNFAQGEMAMFSTFIAWSLAQDVGFWPAVFLAVGAAFLIGAAVERVVMRPVENAPELNGVIVTLGLFAVFNSVALWIYGPIAKRFENPFDRPVDLGPVIVSGVNLAALGAAVIIMTLMFLLFRYTKVGLAMRATAENRTAARLMGIRTGWMLSLGWGLATAVGAVAGILVAPVVFVSPNMLFSLFLFAFASAVLGGLTSPAGAILGGLALGVLRNLAATYVPEIGSQLDTVIALAVIIAILMVRPEGLLGHRRLKKV
ncbi:MAG TPA: branched-chain amino acid ABC transporter permease [Dehalococcoidia bacterium]